MYWRVERGGRLWDQTKGEPARQAFRSLVESGRVSGILAFDHGQPVGWCCLGPRSDFPRLKRVRALQRERSENASPGWAVVCFFVLAPKRRLGIGTRLLKAATGFAFSAGASEVEGYPVKLPAAGVLPGPFAWTGVARMFERAGYRALPSPDPERPVFLARRPDVPAAAPV
jgi:GNAT superfamily N-acetyltransferase